jgi:hypothetical protein
MISMYYLYVLFCWRPRMQLGSGWPLFAELPREKVFSEPHLARERCSDGAPLCDQSM